MTGAPTWVDEGQLAELGVDLTAESRLRRDGTDDETGEDGSEESG
jgi:hypothetical protein